MDGKVFSSDRQVFSSISKDIYIAKLTTTNDARRLKAKLIGVASVSVV